MGPAAGPPDADVRELRGLPSVAPLLARAALTTAGRPGAAAGLPRRALVVRDQPQDPNRLVAYLRLCGFGLTDAVPATWLHVLTFPLQVALMADRAFPFALAGLVHASNDMTLLRPVGPGDRLHLSVRAEGLTDHRRGHTFNLVGEAHLGDDLAWTGRSTYLARTGGGSDVPPRPVGEGGLPGDNRATADEAAASTPAGQRWRLPADLGRRYAAVSGDANPLHLHPLTARLFGFRRPIAHGMWTHARALAALGGRLPGTYRATVTFTRPIPLPSAVLFGAAAAASGWEFAVRSGDGTRMHLVGGVQGA